MEVCNQFLLIAFCVRPTDIPEKDNGPYPYGAAGLLKDPFILVLDIHI